LGRTLGGFANRSHDFRDGIFRLNIQDHPLESSHQNGNRLRVALLVIDDGGKPLTSADAWRVYDRLYDDDRMTFVAEPPDIDKQFRERATARTASPKLWADAWLLAFAHVAEGVLVTFDKALASRGAHCLLPKEEKQPRQR
jgi:hypothetical protein